MKYKIYCDGAATMRKVNGEYLREAGGWAFAEIKDNEIYYSACGRKEKSSNNEMELTSIYEALTYAINKTSDPHCTIFKVHSDSAYAINCITQWAAAWKRNGWTRGKKHEPIQNLELIQKIYDYYCRYHVEFVKVNGHSTNEFNNFVDNLAVKAKKGEI